MRGWPLLLVAAACTADDENRADIILALEGDALAGASVYQGACATCHGASGEGGVGPGLEGVPGYWTERELVRIVVEGLGDMPAFGELSDQEVADVVAYVEETW